MAGKPKRRLLGLAAPTLAGEPLAVRLCRAFVDNLAMILRGAFIVGALSLAQQFDTFTEKLSQPVAAIEPVVERPVIVAAPSAPAGQAEPVVSDRVKHFLNCTYDEYRRENYAACVDEPSGIYHPPEADPDDSGSLFRRPPVRLAHLLPAPGNLQSGTDCSDFVVCGLSF
jgi:hypothetical protein